MLWHKLAEEELLLPLQLEFEPTAFLPECCHSQHMQSLGARKPQLKEKGFNTLKTLEKTGFFFICEVLSNMSCTLLCCRCSDDGLDRQGRVPHQMPAVLHASLCPPWGHSTGSQHWSGKTLSLPSHQSTFSSAAKGHHYIQHSCNGEAGSD